MTRKKASIIVECDNGDCSTVMEIFLTTTARGYDERNVEDDLTAADWVSNPNYDFCCQECYQALILELFRLTDENILIRQDLNDIIRLKEKE